MTATNEQIKFTANWLGAKLAVLLFMAGIGIPMLGGSPWYLLLILAAIGCYGVAHWSLGRLR